MKLCTRPEPVQALEEIHHIITFMSEAMCNGRELAFSNIGLCGAQTIFWALAEDVDEVRESMSKSR